MLYYPPAVCYYYSEKAQMNFEDAIGGNPGGMPVAGGEGGGFAVLFLKIEVREGCAG